MSLFNTPDLLLADLDFDGNADLWVTGYPDGQGRIRTSDVWLYRPDREAYVYDSTFSAIENLDVAPAARRLATDAVICGCSGACYYGGVYAVEQGRPVQIRRFEQTCTERDGRTGVRYREYERQGDSLRVTFETRAPNDPATVFPEHDSLTFVDHTAYPLR